jgi:hypothetical protein
MSKIKAGIAVLIVGGVLCGVVASSASARWFIEGEELSGSAALATTTTVDEPIKLTAAGVNIECKGLNDVKTEIKAPSRLVASSLVFTKCESKEKNCTLSKTEIGTVPVLAEATQEEFPKAKVTFKPEKGSVFATFKYEGETCAAAGVQPVAGAVTFTMPTGQSEEVSQEILSDGSAGEIKIGSSTASLTGSASLTLASGKEWKWIQPGVPVMRAVRLTGEGNTTKECRFNTTGKKCVIRAEIVSNPNGRNLEIIDEAFLDIRGAEFVFVTPATGLGTERECKLNLVIGSARDSSCALEVEYVGPPNPARRRYVSVYFITVKEVGGAELRAEERVTLAAS